MIEKFSNPGAEFLLSARTFFSKRQENHEKSSNNVPCSYVKYQQFLLIFLKLKKNIIYTVDLFHVYYFIWINKSICNLPPEITAFGYLMPTLSILTSSKPGVLLVSFPASSSMLRNRENSMLEREGAAAIGWNKETF